MDTDRQSRQRRLVILLHARRCANHSIHGRFNPAESADHYLRTSRVKLYVLTSSRMCVRNNVTNLLWTYIDTKGRGGQTNVHSHGGAWESNLQDVTGVLVGRGQTIACSVRVWPRPTTGVLSSADLRFTFQATKRDGE